MKRHIVTVLLMCLLPNLSHAVSTSGTANVNLIKALVVNETGEVDFGSIPAQDGQCNMLSNGDLEGVNGQDCKGTSTPGTFSLSGTADQNIIVAVSAGTTVDGVTFSPEVDGTPNRTLNAGDSEVKIIGALDLSNATTGSKLVTYTFTAHYE